MDATLKGVLALVDATDVEARCAALLVLTHLKAADDRTVRTIGAAVESRNVVVRDFAVGYFEQVRPPDGIGYLLPLLDTPDDPLRQRVVATLTAYGAPAVTAVRKLFPDAPRRRIGAIIDLAARVRSSAALDLLFDVMGGDDFDASRTACDALLAAVPALEARSRTDLFGRADRLAAAAKGHRIPLVAAAKLFGALADAKARGRLLKMLDPKEPPVVRTHALGALGACLRGAKLTEAEVDALLPLLDETDEAGFLRPAIRLLEDHPLDKRHLATLNRLAESPQSLVKRFAVQQLGRFDSTPVVKTLIGYLTDDSFARRNQATASLKTMPGARAALMKELLACDDERKAWTLADILLVHDRQWKRDTVDALWTRLERALDTREDRLFAAYFHVLNALDADALAVRIRARADRLRKGKRFADSARTLTLIKDSPAFDNESRFALALAELKTHPHTLASVARRQDPALELLRALANSPFPLSERLRRERLLTPDDLYYVAFNLAEGRGEDTAVARDLLDTLVAKHGRTKVGQAAKNKLRLLPSDR